MSIVRFDSATKQFSEDSYGVKEVTFSISPGELVFVTGQSGSGKTTLLRLLLKEYTTTSGEVFFHDTALSSIKPRHIHLHRRKIGMVFQDYKLIPEMNIWENIALPLSLTGKSNDEIERRVTDLLNLIKLPEKAMLFPSQLSGGEAQRVGIARALAIGPELIIADEPTGNLDPENAHSIARLLKKINELGTTIIVATHDKTILSNYPDTRTIVLEKGRLMADADTEALAKKKFVATKKEEEPGKKVVAKATEAEPKKEVAESAPTPEHAHSRLPEEETDGSKESLDNAITEKPPAQSWWSKMFGKKNVQPALQDLADQDSTEVTSSKAKNPDPTSKKSDSDNKKPDKETTKTADKGGNKDTDKNNIKDAEKGDPKDSDTDDSDKKKDKSTNSAKRNK